MADLNNWGADISGALAGDIIIHDDTQYVRFNPEKHDFFEVNISESGTEATSGSGASVNAEGKANFLHARNLTTGTTSTGSSAITFTRTSFPSAAKVIVSYNVETNSFLSDASNEYEVNVGAWVGGVTAPTDGFFFKYLRTTNVNWLCSTMQSSSETATDSGIVVAAATQYNLRMCYDSTTPNVKFYIDNALVATNATNIATSGSNFTRIIAKKSVGTSSRSIRMLGLYLSVIRD